MGLCLFREEENDARIVKLGELKKKFHAVIGKEENLHQECQFLWAQIVIGGQGPQQQSSAGGPDPHQNARQTVDFIDKADVMQCTQKFIDSIDGGDEESLTHIDRFINMLPEQISFEIFVRYVAEIMMVLDLEMGRRVNHAMEQSGSLCGTNYEDSYDHCASAAAGGGPTTRGGNGGNKPVHYCYNANDKNREPFHRNMYVPSSNGNLQSLLASGGPPGSGGPGANVFVQNQQQPVVDLNITFGAPGGPTTAGFGGAPPINPSNRAPNHLAGGPNGAGGAGAPGGAQSRIFGADFQMGAGAPMHTTNVPQSSGAGVPVSGMPGTNVVPNSGRSVLNTQQSYKNNYNIDIGGTFDSLPEPALNPAFQLNNYSLPPNMNPNTALLQQAHQSGSRQQSAQQLVVGPPGTSSSYNLYNNNAGPPVGYVSPSVDVTPTVTQQHLMMNNNTSSRQQLPPEVTTSPPRPVLHQQQSATITGGAQSLTKGGGGIGGGAGVVGAGGGAGPGGAQPITKTASSPFTNVEQVRDALLEEGVLMQVFNSSYELEWKYIKFLRTGIDTAPNQIQLISPQTQNSMKFLLAELEHVERGEKCLQLSDEIAEAATAQVSQADKRLAAFIFGTDGFLILVFPDETLADLCFKAFKTFGMLVGMQ